MPDTTTVVQHIIVDTVSIDSLNQKLSAIQMTLQKSTPQPAISIWIPLLAAIIGGLLVWTGQAIERNRKKRSERKNNLLEIYAYCRKLEAQMKNYYRELAMAKIHVEYWWHSYILNPGPTPNQSRSYDEHIKSLAFAREIERLIGITKADFIGHVRKFEAIQKLPSEIESHLEIISDLSNPKAQSYDSSISNELLRNEIVPRDEEALRERYYLNLVSFKYINNTLQVSLI